MPIHSYFMRPHRLGFSGGNQPLLEVYWTVLLPPPPLPLRQHCLQRWTFCDVLQVPEGPQRWRRYFMARRVVESRLDRGRPGRDYRVCVNACMDVYTHMCMDVTIRTHAHTHMNMAYIYLYR